MIFIEDSDFYKRRSKLLDEDEFFRFVVWLMSKPGAGNVIPGSGGLRKVRWAAKGRGKRGGVRVIYFWWIADEKILLLDIYSKNAKENLTNDELKKLKGKIAP
ncbi:MAG: type II toxin-antitoxin system RelE/ParE family toxin [Verrucomicrobiota bacterium]